MLLVQMNCRASSSPSSRRAWIEMAPHHCNTGALQVALLAEGVDRNAHSPKRLLLSRVALLAEGVDRNNTSVLTGLMSR